nr:hypothetical protein [Tanacetum cinerariifolium]
MRTRSQSRNNFPQQEASPAIVEPLRIELTFLEDQFQEDPPEDPPEVPMVDNQTMEELLQAPTEGYEDAIDSLNFVAGGNFLDKMPRERLKIIEGKSKVHQSRAKEVIAKVSTSSSTPAISSDVAELKDMVRALFLDKKNQSSAPAHSPTPAPVKAVKPNYVTCGGAHSYQNCPATIKNVYRDNIQEQLVVAFQICVFKMGRQVLKFNLRRFINGRFDCFSFTSLEFVLERRHRLFMIGEGRQTILLKGATLKDDSDCSKLG